MTPSPDELSPAAEMLRLKAAIGASRLSSNGEFCSRETPHREFFSSTAGALLGLLLVLGSSWIYMR